MAPRGMRAWRFPPSFQADLDSALARLDLSLDCGSTIRKLKRYQWSWERDAFRWGFLALLGVMSLVVMEAGIIFKLFLLSAYVFGLLLPLTSQFLLPFTPILTWILLFFSSKFIPVAYRPHIWVSVLPTLESVLYGGNISDFLTRYTNSALDVMAWIPYGVVHFAAPFLVGLALWIKGERGSIEFFGEAFGWMNLFGVLVQILVPCAPPWYELRNGLTPADYTMSGSPGGLARIDSLFHGSGYTKTFTSSPVVFGAFPSLHAATSTMEALFLTHFFPKGKGFWWGYVFWLYWSAMYLTHHYLVDLVAGGSLAVICFYYFLPEKLRAPQQLPSSTPPLSPLATSRSAYLLPNGHSSHSDANGFTNGYSNGSLIEMGEKSYSLGPREWEDEEERIGGGEYHSSSRQN